MFKLIVAVAALNFLISSTVPSLGQSTVDPTKPSQRSPLTSAPIRENFAHAANDVNLLQTSIAALQRSVAALRASTEAIANAGTMGQGFIKDSRGTLIVGADQAPGSFGYPLAIFGTSGSQNSLVGQVMNNLSTPTFSFPTGITGYGKEASQGNQVFGVYGLGELTSTTGGVSVGAEFTARNLSGHPPDTNLPPHTSIGTTTNVVTGINDTCGVTTGTTDCSIGVYISNESGRYSQPVFNTAAYLSLFRQYGLYIESQPSGNQFSAVLKNNGNGINLALLTTGTIQANNEVLNVVDASNVSRASIRQNGDAHVNNLVMRAALELTKSTAAALPACDSNSEGWEYAVTDSSSATFNAAFTGGGSNHIVGYCNGTQWVVR